MGTPCQVEGLLYYLGKKEKEHLLTVDLVCYGVPSPGLYKEWIQDIAQKYGSKASRVYFRDKKYGYAGVNVKVMLQNGQACVDAFVSMVYLYDDQTMKVEFNCEDVIRRALEKYGA